MCEVNFEFIIRYLQKEIERLNESKGSDAMDAVKKGMLEFLTQLLDWMKTAIRVERDRIQGARDSIDATLYALMSKSSLKLDDDFKKMIDHASGNALKHDILPMPPSEKNLTAEDCTKMADRLDHLRFELQARNAANSVQKMAFIGQHATLVEAESMLRKIAEEKERK